MAVVAQNGSLIQKVATDNTTVHAVAVGEEVGSFFVPVKAKGALVYSLGGNAVSTSTASGGTASPTGSLVQFLVLN